MQSKKKRKAHRKALRKSEALAYQEGRKKIQKWIKEWQESRADYPVTESKKKKKPLTWTQISRLIKRTNKNKH